MLNSSVARRRLAFANGVPAATASTPDVTPGIAPTRALSYALAAYVAVVVTRAHEVIPFLGQFSPAKLSLLAVVGLLVVNRRQLAWRTMSRTTVARFMFATGLLAIVTVPTAYWPGGSAAFLPKAYLQTFLVFVFVAAAFIHRPTQWLGIHAFVFGALAATVMAFLVPPDRAGRFGIGRTYDPNDTAAFLVIALPFFFLVATEGARARKFALAGIPLVLATIVKTGSRGAIIALAATVPFLLFYAPPRRRALYTGLVAVCALVFSATMTPELRKRFTSLFDQSDYNFTEQDGRKQVLKRGIKYMVDNPVLGVGIDGFQYAEGATKRNEGFGVRYMNAHNAYVQIGAELGFGGLACFLGAIGASWLGCRRVRKRILNTPGLDPAVAKREVGVATAAICSMVGLSVAALFLSTAYNPVTYFMFGLCAAIVAGAPIAGAMNTGARTTAVPVAPSRRSMSLPPTQPAPAPSPAVPRRGRGWALTGPRQRVSPVRWRGGLNR